MLGATLFTVGCAESATEPAPPPPPPPAGQNRAPVAEAGPALTVSAGISVPLDGTASSDADGDVLSYQWSFAGVPNGSAAVLDDETSETPSFTPDLPGEYTVRLVVNDGTEESVADEVVVTAQDNSVSATLDGAGGDIVHTDGMWRMTIPAGGLAASTDITVTLVLPDQYPEELDGLEDEARVYDIQPRGVTSALPPVVTLSRPATGTGSDGSLHADVWIVQMYDLETGAGPVYANHALDVDGPGGEITLTAETPATPGTTPAGATAMARVEFSVSGHVNRMIRFADDGSANDVIQLDNASGSARWRMGLDQTVTTDLYAGALADLYGSGITAAFEDESGGGIERDAAAAGEFVAAVIDGRQVYRNTDTYRCNTAGIGSYRGEGQLRFDLPTLRQRGPTQLRFDAAFDYRVTFRRDVECEAPPRPFQGFSLTLADGMGSLGLRLWGAAGQEGGAVFDENGDVQFRISGVPTTEATFGMAGSSGNVDARDWILISTSGGLYTARGPFNGGDVTVTPKPLPVPGDLNGDGSVLDILGLRSTLTFAPPSGAHVTANTMLTDAYMVTQFEGRNIAFLVPDATGDDLVVDPTLADAFYPGGVNVFDNARPVSAWASPNGFTADDPMLAVTVADDGSGTGQLLKIDLVGGVAVPTAVTGVVPNGEPRKLRCLGELCVISSFGTPFGFGGLTFFTWDGQSAIDFLIGVTGTRSIGVDMFDTGNGILVAATDFDGEFNGTDFDYLYRIVEFDAQGQLVGFTDHEAPDSCTNPGHIQFRSANEVIISCNGSNNVVGATF